MLHHVKTYYSNLFCNRDKYLNVEKFEKLEGIKISQPLNKNLGQPLNVQEIGIVLKKMKHNKTPGIDGITAEFLKVFWDKLKMFITNAINCCLTNGEMSITLRQCIIVCLPKGDKDRSLIKNWRPISLLSIFYKLASGTIAERLKTVLDQIISKTQSGFVPGRNISDCTRLIYDLLYLAQDKDYTGLLIDFEKAFDSISWKFLYKTLKMFGFSEDFIRWVKLFNTNIKAYILQCGFLSEEIIIERGCRQGDPLSAYLFLLGAEVLSTFIKLDKNIKGLKFGDQHIKMTQFADDTTLILDGTQCSLEAARNILDEHDVKQQTTTNLIF